MSEITRVKDRAIIGLIIGTAISTGFYLFKYGRLSGPPVIWILWVFGLLGYIPRMLFMFLLQDTVSSAPEFFEFLYWPIIFTLVARSRRWALWSAIVAAVHIGIVAVFIYMLMHVKIAF
ncbi:MAG TPA: hypothetical protein VFC63_07070 [Blastocatellia bacterium]|nr:hypothetical protein [Blastocatellia bacterium]